MKTPEKLEVLKKAKVVDSGAQGFVHFLEGIGKLIHSGNFKQFLSRHETVVETLPAEVLSPEETAYRYCTEGMLSGEALPLEEIKAILKEQGDSVIVAGNQSRCRFHFHTDYPEKVFVKLRSYGQLTEQKVDDMVRQQDALIRRKASVALVTDSIADLPRSFQDAYQVYQIPLQVMVEGAPFLDQVTLTTPALFQILEEVAEYPTSSQPTVKKVQETLDFLLQHYDDVLMLAVSAQNSGTWQTFCQAAAAMEQPGKRIRVIDTKKNSGAEGLLVMMAAEAIEKGESLEAVAAMVEKAIPKTHIYVSVATFEYMVRGGRVSPMKGRLAKWMNLKPIVSLDETGKGVAFGKAFSRAANTRKIMEIVKGHHRESPVERYCVVHADAPEKAGEYAEKLTEMLGIPPVFITEISPIVALNAGRGAVAVALIQQ